MKIGLQHKNEKIENSRIQPKYEEKVKIISIQPKYENIENSQNST